MRGRALTAIGTWGRHPTHLAALAYAHRRPEEIPTERLASMVDAAGEPPEVRTAALLGLSYALAPSAYVAVLRVSTTPSHPAWKAATSRLGDLDDGFALDLWRDLDPAVVGAEGIVFARAQADRVRARVAGRETAAFVPRVRPMLERAAWVDLTGGPFEDAFVTWTLRTVGDRLGAPAVREAVRALETVGEGTPQPASDDAALLERVRAYAKGLLAGNAEDPRPR